MIFVPKNMSFPFHAKGDREIYTGTGRTVNNTGTECPPAQNHKNGSEVTVDKRTHFSKVHTFQFFSRVTHSRPSKGTGAAV